MKLKNFLAIYHRNGVCGEGFYACSFVESGTEYTAVLFDGVPDGPWDAEAFAKGNGRCAVLSGPVSNRFRGDWFESAIRAAIIVQHNADSMAAHRHDD